MRKLAILVILLLIAAKIIAAPDSNSYIHYTVDNILPSNNVYCLHQDHQGYMWIGTDNGLVKYNGYTARTFTVADGLPSNDIWKLYEDKKGRMWLGTHATQIGYIYKDAYHAVIPNTDGTTYIHDLYESGEDVYFLYSSRSNFDISVAKYTSGKLYTTSLNDVWPEARYYKNDRLPLNLGGADFDNSGSVVAALGAAYYRLRLSPPYKRQHLFSLPLSEYLPNQFQTRSFLFQNGLFQYTFGSDLNIIQIFRHHETKILLGNEQIYVFYKAAQNQLHLITNRSIYSIDPHFQFHRLVALDTLPFTAQPTYMLNDCSNGQWYATKNDGVYYNTRKLDFFAQHRTSEDLKNSKLIGTTSRYTFWWDRVKQVCYKIDAGLHIDTLATHGVVPKHITSVNDTVFWLLAANDIYKYNIARGQLTSFSSQWSRYIYIDTIIDQRYNVPKYSFVNYTDLRFINDSNAIAVCGINLNRFKFTPATFYCYVLKDKRYEKSFFLKKSLQMVCYNSSEILVYDIVKNKQIDMNREYLHQRFIDNIYSVAVDTANNMYILAGGRLSAINLKNGYVKVLPVNCTLANARLTCFNNMVVICGTFGIAYAAMSKNGGLSPFQILPNALTSNYTKSLDFTVNDNGRFFLNTNKGLYSFTADELVATSGLRTDSSSFMPLSVYAPVTHTLAQGDTLILPCGATHFNITAINYLGNGGLKYSYYIDQVSPYMQQSISGELAVNTLVPDRYYRVICQASDNLWTSTPTKFFIYIQPYWYQSHKWHVVFWISGVLALILLLSAAVFITQRIVARNAARKQALTDLELRAVYAQINPHFIFNTLSAALYFISKQRFDDAYTHVSKFSRLLRSYLKSSQDRFVLLSEEIEMLRNYVELQKTRFEQKFNFKIEVDNKLPVQNIYIPSLLLQPLVENAINHGLFHKEESGFLLLQFLQGANNSELICIIEDTGVGRARAQEIKEESSTQRGSYGTRLTDQLISLFKKYEKMDIYLEYTDKQYPETGTIVKLTIKNINYVA